jgi:hypothetical protein
MVAHDAQAIAFMKVRLVVTFGLVLVGAAVLSQIGSMWRPSRDAGPSGLAFDAVSANLGVVKDRYAPVRFRFTNQSSVPLTISRVVPECGCTSFVLSPSETLAPGQTGTLDVRVDTDSMRGEVSKRVVMHLADPRQPPLTLTIYLKKPFVFVSPGDEIQISHVGFDRPVLGKEIRLSNMGFSAFAFKGWKSPSKRVSVVPVAAARGTAAFQDLRVIVDSSSYGAGRFDEPLTLMAETDGQPWEQDVK